VRDARTVEDDTTFAGRVLEPETPSRAEV
jgi:hypothetical protein